MTDPPPEPDSGDRRKRDRRRSDRRSWVPEITNASDFVVVIFAITVALLLVVLTVGVVLTGILGYDIKSYFAILTSIITSMISALVGYLAGKGVGRQEGQS